MLSSVLQALRHKMKNRQVRVHALCPPLPSGIPRRCFHLQQQLLPAAQVAQHERSQAKVWLETQRRLVEKGSILD